MRIRKQENNLTIADLLQHPAWEFALDEEDVQGQNEKSLRPYLIPPPLDRDKAYLLVRAKFTLANGAEKIGFIKPIKQGDIQLMQPLLPYDLNPVIVTDQGQVAFCYGIFKPDQVKISENYKRLGYGSENVFPIEFSTDIDVSNSVAYGIIEGFLYIEQDTQNFFRLDSTDIKSVR